MKTQMKEQTDMLQFEKEFVSQGKKLIAGIDEAGRGPLAGPVVVASVIMPFDNIIDGINDSKKLSEKKREMLFDKIINEAVSYSIQFVDEKVIDKINIRNASFLAMNNAVNDLKIKPDFVLVDGNAIKDMTIPHECIIKGDLKCNSVGAASILAKVARDRFMQKIHKEYPEYGFDKNKGYGTKLHYEMIEKYGILPIHRLTFLKKILGE